MLNDMIARSEEELEIFQVSGCGLFLSMCVCVIVLRSHDWWEQRMDIERVARETMVSCAIPSLLNIDPHSFFLTLWPCLSLQDPNLRHKLRLISEEELPSWLVKDVDEVDQLTFEENEGRLFGYGEGEMW